MFAVVDKGFVQVFLLPFSLKHHAYQPGNHSADVTRICFAVKTVSGF